MHERVIGQQLQRDQCFKPTGAKRINAEICEHLCTDSLSSGVLQFSCPKPTLANIWTHAHSLTHIMFHTFGLSGRYVKTNKHTYFCLGIIFKVLCYLLQVFVIHLGYDTWRVDGTRCTYPKSSKKEHRNKDPLQDVSLQGVVKWFISTPKVYSKRLISTSICLFQMDII